MRHIATMPSTKRAAAQQPAAPKKMYHTCAAIEERAKGRLAERQAAADAFAWCRRNDKGARAAIATGLFKPATVMMVRNRFNGAVSKVRDYKSQLMTNTEREKLATWLLECGDGQDPKVRDCVTA